jgi:hypothetical protein
MAGFDTERQWDRISLRASAVPCQSAFHPGHKFIPALGWGWAIGPQQEQFRDSPQQYWPNTCPYVVHFPKFPFSCLISTLRRRDSSVGIATRLRTGRSGGWIPLKARDFCLLHNVHTGSEAHPVSCSVGTKVLCRGVQRPGREVDHPPPSSARFKNEWSYNSTHPIHSWRGQEQLQFLMTLFDQKCLIRWGDDNCE